MRDYSPVRTRRSATPRRRSPREGRDIGRRRRRSASREAQRKRRPPSPDPYAVRTTYEESYPPEPRAREEPRERYRSPVREVARERYQSPAREPARERYYSPAREQKERYVSPPRETRERYRSPPRETTRERYRSPEREPARETRERYRSPVKETRERSRERHRSPERERYRSPPRKTLYSDQDDSHRSRRRSRSRSRRRYRSRSRHRSPPISRYYDPRPPRAIRILPYLKRKPQVGNRYEESRIDLKCAFDSLKKMKKANDDVKFHNRLMPMYNALEKCVKELTTGRERQRKAPVDSMEEVLALLIGVDEELIKIRSKMVGTFNHAVKSIKQFIKKDEENDAMQKQHQEWQRQRMLNRPWGFHPGMQRQFRSFNN